MSREPRLLRHYPFTTVRVACRPCGRAGCYGLARLAEAHGADMPLADLLLVLTAACRWQRKPGERNARPYEPRCLAFFPDLTTPGPDRPALRLVAEPNAERTAG